MAVSRMRNEKCAL